MSVYVYGDSHGHYLFARAGLTIQHCLPGHTMHRVGRDGLATFPEPIEPSAEDVLIFTFGEIDVRTHLLRMPAIKGWPLQAEIADLAQRYINALSAWVGALSCRPARICVMGVVPPIDPLRGNAVLPVYGSLPERLVAWFLLNEALKIRAREAGFTFVPIPKVYQARDGSLKQHLGDGQAHIAKDCTEPVVRAVERALGVGLAFRLLPARRHLLRSATRRIAIFNRDWAALWALGENVIDA